MDYKKCYENLVNSRKKLNRTKNKENYFENHHILPKSLGGTNNKENLVLLTFKEHFIAHLLLTKMYDGDLKRKMCYALWRMSSSNDKTKRILSASQYKICREAQKKAMQNNIVSQETKDKIRISNTGKKRTPEVNEKNRIRNTGKKQSNETKQKRSDKLMGKSRPQNVIDKIRKNNPLKKSVICSNGNKYESIKIAAQILGIHFSNISAVCNGRRISTNGLTFKFLEYYEQN